MSRVARRAQDWVPIRVRSLLIDTFLTFSSLSSEVQLLYGVNEMVRDEEDLFTYRSICPTKRCPPIGQSLGVRA